MRQDEPTFGDMPEDEAVVEVNGLIPDQLDPEIPPRVVGTGADHLMVSVRDRDVLAECRPDKEAFVEVASTVGAQGLYVATIGRITSDDVPAVAGAGVVTAQGWIRGPEV